MAADAAYLKRVWTKVMERKKRNQTRYQLYGELALAQRVLRDFADAQPGSHSRRLAPDL